jgi:hypothetical protein
MIKRITILLFAGITTYATAQTESFTTRFYETYERFRETSVNQRRFKHEDLMPILDKHRNNSGFEIQKVGESIEGRSLNLISLGSGPIDILLWSQMHGDEPTATQAIFDILNFFASEDFKREKKELLNQVKIHFLPMLNPDGAERFQRRNFLGVDINRDALMLQSPESRTLKRVRDSLDAEFGFNLHDQSRYYNAERTPKPATISYLAPAFNYEKDVNEVRSRAMKVIGYMNRILQKYAPGQVGRYNDDFEPRAFGDNIQKWGTSAILIESGGYPDDIEKQEIRKLNYVSILSAIYAIGSGSYTQVPLEDYHGIPNNNRMLFDLKIEGVTYPLNGINYTVDIGVFKLELNYNNSRDFWNVGQIVDFGDLSTYYAYETVRGEGLVLKQGNIYPEIVPNIEALNQLDLYALLKAGISYVRVRDIPENLKTVPLGINVLGAETEISAAKWDVGDNPTFVLWDKNKPVYSILNGFLVDLSEDNPAGIVRNGIIIR